MMNQPDAVSSIYHAPRRVPGIPDDLYLTADVPPIPGRIKVRPEDFLVEEIPLYEPCGEGEHIYILIEKKDVSTFEVIDITARHFGVRRGDVGYAGLKDKTAITRQVLSIHVPGRTPEDFPMLRHPQVNVLWTDMHRNKLRIGHLRGNRFSIRIRNVAVERILDAQCVMRTLHVRGVPNFFGPQRFGLGRANHLLGRHLVLDEPRALIETLFRTDASPAVRDAFDRCDFSGALARCEHWRETERCILAALVRAGATELTDRLASRAARTLPTRSTRLWNSALQSALFNGILSGRLGAGSFDTLEAGDLAWKHDNGAVFRVRPGEAASGELRARLDALEISPSGPLWGPRMTRAGVTEGDGSRIDSIETDALVAAGLDVGQIDGRRADGRRVLDGTRRPLRIPMTDPEIEAGADENGTYIRLAFDLPRGCYATTVLREVMKAGDVGAVDAAEPAGEDEG